MEKTEPMKLGASAPVRLLRSAYEDAIATTRTAKGVPLSPNARKARAAEAVLTEAAIIFGAGDGDIEKISPEWRERFLKIARGEATIVGYSHTGLTYHDDPFVEYVPARDDHGKEGVIVVWQKPSKEAIKGRIIDRWLAVTGVQPDENLLSAFDAIAENDAEAWQRADAIAAELAVKRGWGVEDVETPIDATLPEQREVLPAVEVKS